jgi:hypothetical protein
MRKWHCARPGGNSTVRKDHFEVTVNTSHGSSRVAGQTQIIVSAMTLSAFGPYVLGGLRTEQLTAYALLALTTPFVLTALTRTARAWWFILPWLIILAAATLSELFPLSGGPMPWPKGSLLAGLDNVMLPIAVLLIIVTFVPKSLATYSLDSFSAIVAWGGAINGVITILSLQIDITAWLRPFWTGGAGFTVAQNAASMGRYSGIFNQPAEAGLFYSIAGLLAVYRFTGKPYLLGLLMSLATVGGLMTVSKVFILLGMPLVFLYLVHRLNFSGRLLGLPAVALGAMVVSLSGVFRQWDGLWFLKRLLSRPPGDQGILEFYTAGRLGTNASLAKLVEAVMDRNPITGIGLAGWSVAYDSGWTEVLIIAGLTGVICLTILHANLLILASRLEPVSIRWLGYAAAIVTFGASFGIPSLTANRSSTLIWILTGLLLKIADHTSSSQSSIRKAVPRHMGWPSIEME